MQKIKKLGALRGFFLLLLLTALVRCLAVRTSVINWDETIYAIVADAWLHGHPPYSSVWDNKPPLLYVLFAIFQKIIPDPVIAMRALGIAAAAVTASLVGRLAAARGASRDAAFFASLAFVFGSICNGGLATNAELLMVVFTSAAMLAACSQRAFYAGLGFGAAVCVKHVAAFEILALLSVLLTDRRGFLQICGWFSLGGAAVPLLMLAVLTWAGALTGFWQEALVDNLIRVGGSFDWTALRHALGAQLCWILLYASLVLLRDRAIWLWLLSGCIGIICGKYFYTHYFIQILPALCVAFALALDRLFRLRSIRPAYALALLLPLLAGGAYKISSLFAVTHDERAVAARIPKGASLYVFNGQPVLYLLAGAPPPTAYVLPTLLTGRLFSTMAGVSPLDEINRIFRGAPEFVVTTPDAFGAPIPDADKNPAAYALAQRWLAADYYSFARFPDAVVYRHRIAALGSAAMLPPGTMAGAKHS